MTILAQHGWGKTNKVERGIDNGSIQGVIMSPRDESPTNLASFLSDIQTKNSTVERLVDPQFHIGTISPVRDGKLVSYEHYRPHLTPASFSPMNINEFVRTVLHWQSGLAVSSVVSPTVMVDDLGSQWAQIAMMLAQGSVAQHDDSKPLLIGLVVGEDALRQRALVDNWLNDLTLLDVDGFYLVVRRSSQMYRQHYDPDVLASLLHVCYSLAELNQYRVFLGYTDMVTPLLHAVGVTGTAAGWFTGLRHFTLRRFEPVTGGRQPRPRYSSRPLLNSIYVTELGGIHNGGQVSMVLSNTPFDTRFNGTTNPENVDWPADEAALQHWGVLSDASQSLLGSTVSDRLDSAANVIALARVVYAQAAPLVPFTPETGPTHLDQWLDALSTFRSSAGV